KPHAYGHALGNVVQSDGQHEEPDPVDTRKYRPMGPADLMLMGNETVQPEHQHHTQPQPQHYGGGTGHAVTEDGLPCPHAWQDQGEGAGGEHHAGGKTQHAVPSDPRDIQYDKPGKDEGTALSLSDPGGAQLYGE